ncbi:MAG: PLP-dependent aminotransferase family protein [Eggerthellaceae bacterium]|nr:PLP-dependent aminotransferase family protein [Eggerthellaceae bacterium]
MDIKIDRSAPTPAYRQLYEQVSSAIESGELKAGDRLPHIRELAAALGIARNTVEAAYKQLAVEGFAKGRRGLGYIVEELDFSVLDPEPANADAAVLIRESEEQRNRDPLGGAHGMAFDFCYGNRSVEMLPMHALRGLADAVLSDACQAEAARYMDPFGHLGLRKQIVRHLRETRGIRCVPEQVILQPGTQVALSKIASILPQSERIVAMEDPGYNAARYAFQRAGCAIRPIPVHAGQRAFLDALHASDARMAMVTPSNQFPLGFIMPLSTRLKLIEWAKGAGAYLIEDDYCCEYRYRSSPSPALRSIDEHRTIYLGTMSKILTPSVRISYLVLPPELLERWNAVHSDDYCALAWFDQALLEAFMASDAWRRYTHSTVRAYQLSHDALLGALEREMGSRITIYGKDAGLHLLVEDALGRSQEELVELAKGAGVRVYPTEQYWAHEKHPMKSLILIGFSGIARDRIPEGIRRLAAAWR